MSVQPIKMGFDVPCVEHRNPLSFAERLADMSSGGSPSLAARGVASAGLMFGGGALAVLLFLLAMAGLSDGQTLVRYQRQSLSIFQTTPFSPRDILQKLSGKPQETARSIGRIPMVYHNGQTVAVVALGPKKTLLECELIETYNPGEKEEVLNNLSQGRLRSLEVSFDDMMELMRKCHELAEIQSIQGLSIRGPRRLEQGATSSPQDEGAARTIGGGGAFTLFQGIMPGTKWCGSGNLAETYYDLGPDEELDLCCRSHDLCPVKIGALTTLFNLTNNSLYAKSHCECDEMLYKCLKKVGHQNAMLIGNFFFNFIQVPCIDRVKRKGNGLFSDEMKFQNTSLIF